jgi:hypothetical protein
MKNLQIDVNELKKWKLEEIKKEDIRFATKSEKNKDPKKEKKKDRLKKELGNSYFYKHEEKSYRKQYQKSFKSKWKIEKSIGEYHIPINKEYKTYGYLTW